MGLLLNVASGGSAHLKAVEAARERPAADRDRGRRDGRATWFRRSRSPTRCELRAPRSASSAASAPRPSSSRRPATSSTRSTSRASAARNPLKAARAAGKAAPRARAPPAASSSATRRRRPRRRRLRRRPGRPRRHRGRSRSSSTEADSHLGLTNRALAPPRAPRLPRVPARGPRRRPLHRHRPRRPADLHRPRRTPARSSASGPTRPACSSSAARSAPARSTRPRRRRSRTRPTASSTSPAPATTRTSTAPGPHYVLLDYLTPFGIALAAADAAVARAGGSVFELAQYGLPAVLIPYPHASADHQTTNARWMAERGAARDPPGRRAHARAPAGGDRRAARATRGDVERPRRALAKPDAARDIAPRCSRRAARVS